MSGAGKQKRGEISFASLACRLASHIQESVDDSRGGEKLEQVSGSAQIRAINEFLQNKLRVTSQQEVTAVEAARWLDEAGILHDDESRPGRNLRGHLRGGEVIGAERRPNVQNGHWFITHDESGASE